MRHTSSIAALAAFLTLATAAAAPAPARAQSAESQQAERTRLRTQLAKVNAEIDALKHAGGGVRDDYRLRARLADAESLARRLTDIEARLGIRADGGPRLQTPPTAAPTDGPADLDAKADILADQSRRVRAQADAIGRRATDARGRQELRRRAADLDRDPFAPMEGSKRRIANSAGTNTLAPSSSAAQPISTADRTSGATGGSSLLPGASNPAGMPNGTGGPPLIVGGSTPLSAQLRDLLDTATLTDLRRIEAAGGGASSAQVLERASTALRARADWLDGQSRAMRARARAK